MNRLDERSTLPTVAITVGDALRRHGITAVLTGGACASLYMRGKYMSVDVDFVLRGDVTRRALDEAMASVGFDRRRDHYVHPKLAFYVEFPRGPLAIGEDHRLLPIRARRGRATSLTLSATDACRDRLAAFYHWNDRQSLAAAVEISRSHRVDLARIRRWSDAVGARAKFEEFRAERRSPAARRKPRR